MRRCAEIEQGRARDSVRRSWQATVTIVLPRFSGRAARRAATATLAPVLIPPRIPSSRASRRPQAKASSLVTVSTPLSKLVSRFFGMKPAADALDLVRPGLPPEITGESAGSTAIAWNSRLALAEESRYAGDRAAGADAGHEDDRPARRCRPRFPARSSLRGSPGWPDSRTVAESSCWACVRPVPGPWRSLPACRPWPA